MTATNKLTGNYFICENEVFVEGKSIGQFQSFSSEQTRDNIVGTASVTMPFYSMAVKAAKENSKGSSIAVKKVGANVVTYARINPADWNIKVGARIQIYIGYKSNKTLNQKFERRLEFDGFIKEVIGGFPTTIKCEDMAFMLKFGTVQKQWTTATKLSTLVSELCEIANAAFNKYRKDNNFTASIPKLKPSGKSIDSEFVLKLATGVSPYDVLQKVIVGMYKLYGGVNVRGDNNVQQTANVWIGYGIGEESNSIGLDTSINVVDCNIVPKNLLFENFRVIVRYLDNGELKKIEKGEENGVVYEIPFTPNKSANDMASIANSALLGLKANRNKGTITTKCYPYVPLFSFINFKHTIFTTLSGDYYVIGREMKCDENGYNQILTITDKTFLYLSD